MLYRIYEVFPDQTLHDTNKVIDCSPPTGHNTSSIVNMVFETYGFGNEYTSYYKINVYDENKFNICYNYIGDGFRDTWVLVLEEDNEKENHNE
jgi:hypothetical protein